MIRFYLIVALALALAASIWWQDRTQKKLNATRVELSHAQATIEVERENTRKANEAAKRYQTRSDALEADRRNNPLPAVRVCRKAPSVPETRATAVPGEAAQADHSGENAGDSDSIDIGPALDDFATDAEANLNQCEELIRWVQER